MTAIAVTIAGSDSSGGAGIQADLKTFSALGVYGASVIAALTAQNTTGVRAIHPVPGPFIHDQLDAVFSDLAVKAVKIGMVGGIEAIEAVADGLRQWKGAPVVLDPVMVATSGDPLLDAGAERALVEELFPLADLITPNLQEVARLLDSAIAPDETAMRSQAEELLALGARAVLIKGGHGEGADAVDILLDGEQWHVLRAPRVETENSHGTGCTLSSAIAAFMAKGETLSDAVASAKAYVTESLRHADELKIGNGSGPVHHFHALWPPQAS